MASQTRKFWNQSKSFKILVYSGQGERNTWWWKGWFLTKSSENTAVFNILLLAHLTTMGFQCLEDSTFKNEDIGPIKGFSRLFPQELLINLSGI